MRATTTSEPFVAQGATLVKDAIRTGRSRCQRGSQPKYVEQLAKDTLCRDRSRCVEQVCAFVNDIARRGELADAEEIGLRLIAFAREAHFAGKVRPTLSLADAHIAEERAEGEAEDAETEMVHRPTRTTYDKYLRKASVHTSKRRDLNDVVRTLQVMASR